VSYQSVPAEGSGAGRAISARASTYGYALPGQLRVNRDDVVDERQLLSVCLFSIEHTSKDVTRTLLRCSTRASAIPRRSHDNLFNRPTTNPNATVARSTDGSYVKAPHASASKQLRQ
jgi:hypothetical protein